MLGLEEGKNRSNSYKELVLQSSKLFKKPSSAGGNKAVFCRNLILEIGLLKIFENPIGCFFGVLLDTHNLPLRNFVHFA